MINLEVLRLELNYLQQVVNRTLGNMDARKLGKAIMVLVTCFFKPTTYDSLSLSHLQAVEQYLNQIQQKVEPCEYKLLLNNISTIRIFLEKINFEISKC
ncbi:hypothetical protein [Proteiniborus sp. MB09-C3]|uniref:hypothetical protein n=1 Tax=Proteiniborus sp. MB09-C3 TaxID=3050072 RepID=UPI00255722E2|nr:hypothetical protein [Proteiniborus sp. MB09-C3]WIV12824.1 hypothetical protein QO263_03670 [Proteiniborus sp. MB09-C3]